MDFAKYLCLYRASWRELQKASPEVSTYEDRQLYSTWQLSLDHIRQQSEISSKLLQLWAYFDNQDVWFELLREGRASGPQWLCQLTEDQLSFSEVVRVLCNHGLIEVGKSLEGAVVESQGYGMHSCVHAWTIHVVNQEWDAEMAGVAVECVGRHVPEHTAQHSSMIQRQLLRHLTKCWGFIIDGRVDEDRKDWILHTFGNVCSNQGRFKEAEKMYLRALQGKEKAWGPDHTSTLSTVNNLGALYTSLGRLDEAEKMYLRALQGYEKALGQQAVKTYIPALNTALNMAALFQRTGRSKEAKLLYEQALLVVEAVFGRTSNRYRSVAKVLDGLHSAREQDT